MKLTDCIPQREYVFEAYITVNGRYMIIQDDVFDIQEQRSLGNIWGSLDVFKTMFRNVMVDNTEYKQIREEILSLPLLESKESLYNIRNHFINEQSTWVGRELANAKIGITNFANTAYEGAKKLGVAVSQSDWKKIWQLLRSGVKYFLRSLKEAMFSNTGLVVDSMLIAIGVGKTVQWIPWALILSLDVYQFISNDYPGEDANMPTWLKLLDIGISSLGVALSGVVAKSAKQGTKPLINAFKTGGEKGAQVALKNSPTTIKTIRNIINISEKVPGIMRSAAIYLSKIFPSGANFINGIIGYLSSVLTKMVKALTAAIGTGSMLYGLDKGMDFAINKINNRSGEINNSNEYEELNNAI